MQLLARAMARWVLRCRSRRPARRALLGDEATAGEVMHQRLVDRRVRELEAVEVLSERQLGDGELVLDRARRFSLISGVEQIADAEDALVAALKVKTERLEATIIMYVRRWRHTSSASCSQRKP